jgi:archaellum component FlaD/FlaE
MDDGGFGLFEDDGEGETEEGIDEDVANADAEGFFDDDLPDETEDTFGDEAEAMLDEEGADPVDEEGADPVDEESADETTFDAGEPPAESADASDEPQTTEDGKSFEDLKAEYESGDADWAEDDADAAEELDALGDELDEMNEAALLEAADDAVGEEATADADATAAEPTASAQTAAAADAGAAGPGKPYLSTLPDGYAADLLAVEWLEFLVTESSVREAREAVGYYERIDWISDAVADDLRSYLAGFDAADGAGPDSLTIDHHTRSLRYVSQLDGGSTDGVAMRLLGHGGGGDGVQR